MLFHPQTGSKLLLKTTVLNSNILRPVLVRMSQGSGKLPAVEDLREQVRDLFQTSKREVEFDDIDRESWRVRKFAGFVKLKVRKEEVSTEAGSYECVLSCLSWVLVC